MKAAVVRIGRARPEIGVVGIAVILVLFFTVTSGGDWLSLGNLRSVLQITAILAILAFGEALVITTGEIDISVGSVFGIGALVYLGLAPDTGVALAIPIALAAAVAIGCFNGYVVAKLKIPSLIVTLGTLFIFRGLCYALTEGFHFAANKALRQDPLFKVVGGSEIWGFNNAVLWVLALLVVVHVGLFHTPQGNRLLAVGGDAQSALTRGVRVVRVKWVAFILCSFLAGLAGILEASKLGFADGSFGRLMELEAIASAVVGGCILTGGRSSIVGTAVGAFVLSGIQSYLVIMGIQPQWFILLLGAIVVVAILGDRAFHSWLSRQ
jgi:simple sugar transport system permease protein/ribose transport system permease protein